MVLSLLMFPEVYSDRNAKSEMKVHCNFESPFYELPNKIENFHCLEKTSLGQNSIDVTVENTTHPNASFKLWQCMNYQP